MALRMKALAGQTRVVALAHHSLHVGLGQFQIPEHEALELGAALRVGWDFLKLPQRQGQIALEDLLAEGLRAAEETVRQLFDLAHAELMTAEGQDELLDLLALNPVHAHELANGVHVGIDRKLAAEDLLPDRRGHFGDQSQTHAHPSLAAREFAGDLGHAHAADVFEFINKRGLFQKTQRFGVGNAQKIEDARHFLRPK